MPPISSASGGTAGQRTPQRDADDSYAERQQEQALGKGDMAVCEQPAYRDEAGQRGSALSPIKSSESAFSAWLLAMNLPTISIAPKPRLKLH